MLERSTFPHLSCLSQLPSESTAQGRKEPRWHGTEGARPAPRALRLTDLLLVQPQPEWGRPHRLIKMQPLPNERPASSDEILFAFEWSVEYRRLHQAFEVLIASSPDPNMLLELLHPARELLLVWCVAGSNRRLKPLERSRDRPERGKSLS